MGYLIATSLLIFLFIVSLVAPVNFTFAQSRTVGGEQFPQTVIAASSTDTTPHFLNLKATQQGDAEPERVSGFNLDITNAISAERNSQVLVFADSSVQVIEAKVRTESGQLIDLDSSTQANAFL